MNAATLCYLKNANYTRPKQLFISILERLIPDQILKQDGIAPSGSRHTVGVPEDIVIAAYGKIKIILPHFL